MLCKRHSEAPVLETVSETAFAMVRRAQLPDTSNSAMRRHRNAPLIQNNGNPHVVSYVMRQLPNQRF